MNWNWKSQLNEVHWLTQIGLHPTSAMLLKQPLNLRILQVSNHQFWTDKNISKYCSHDLHKSCLNDHWKEVAGRKEDVESKTET